MKLLQKETFICSLFVFIGGIDLFLRFRWLMREEWTCNEGIMWGVKLPLGVILLLGALLLGYVFFLFARAKHFEEWFFLFLLLIGGGINVLDRIFHDCVLDYFSWPGVLGTLLPNFNLADMMLSFGLMGFLWVNFLNHQTVKH